MKHLPALFLTLLLLCPVYGASAAQPVAPAALGGSSSLPVTRAQFVQALWAHWGSVPYWDSTCFSDVSADALYTAAVCWAYDMGFTLGVGDGLFAPERPITREEAAVLLRRAARHIGRGTEDFLNTALCNDYADISPWCDDSLYWATATGLMDWAEGGLRAPYGTLTHHEVSAIFARF